MLAENIAVCEFSFIVVGQVSRKRDEVSQPF